MISSTKSHTAQTIPLQLDNVRCRFISPSVGIEIIDSRQMLSLPSVHKARDLAQYSVQWASRVKS